MWCLRKIFGSLPKYHSQCLTANPPARYYFNMMSVKKRKEPKQKQIRKHTETAGIVLDTNKSVSNTVWRVQLWFGLISGHLNAHQTCKVRIHSLSVTLCSPCKTSGAFTSFTRSFKYLSVLYQLIVTTLCTRQKRKLRWRYFSNFHPKK